MPAKQKTIKYSVSCTGVGLHTGVQSTVTFHPADENTGIKFIRNDKGDKVVTPDIDNVVPSPNREYNSSVLSLILSNAVLNGSPVPSFAALPIPTLCLAISYYY